MTEEGAHALTVRVVLPQHLRTLAQVGGEVALEVAAPVTVRRLLDALEARYPTLRGTIRDYGTGQRRPFLRFFACEEDLSHESMDAELPRAVAEGNEPLLIIGAIAGG
jgi:molybdopterin synthase sulfur carrier subunit